MFKRLSISPGQRLVGVSAGMMMAVLVLSGVLMLSGCSATGQATSSVSSTGAESTQVESTSASGTADSSDAQAGETITETGDGAHAIEVDGKTAEYSNVEVVKSGDSEGDEADFYGENAAVFATNGATLTLSDMTVSSNGTHANGVFSYGEGTTVSVSDSVIETSGNCSGGIMTTGGGTMNASNLTIHTTGNSSAAIRSDRGGGTVSVTGGSYTTDGTGSPAIYSTADITVNDAGLTSTASQGVVVEGKNSVTLNNVDLVADNNTKNSDKSDFYQAVMIYQSMSGDAAEGEASFTTDGGSITNANGDIFFVNNTVATISLSDTVIVNNDKDGVFLRAAAAGWGSDGSNGGQVTLNASDQAIDGDMIVDDISSLNLYLADSSTFDGAINAQGEGGDVYVELIGDSKWVLTGDSHIKSLTCEADSIDLNGHTLYVDGKAYEAGKASTGDPIEVKVSASSKGAGQGGEPPSGDKPSGEPPSGNPGGKPSGEPPSGGKPGSEPPSGAPDSSQSSSKVSS